MFVFLKVPGFYGSVQVEAFKIEGGQLRLKEWRHVGEARANEWRLLYNGGFTKTADGWLVTPLSNVTEFSWTEAD
jgi:hypothetical protein